MNSPARRKGLCSLFGALVILFAQCPADAQQRGRETNKAQLEGQYKAKLESPFVTKTEWVTSFDEAKKQSKEKKLPIFGYFTRSYGP